MGQNRRPDHQPELKAKTKPRVRREEQRREREIKTENEIDCYGCLSPYYPHTCLEDE